jgi:surface antigen
MVTKQVFFRAGLFLGLAFLISGCNTSSSLTTEPVVLSTPASPTVLAQVKPAMGAFLSGPAGQALDEADRELGLKAQIQAASSGKRSQWRAQKSDAYGYVETASAKGSDSTQCKTYTHVIYSKGRPQRGTGEICQSTTGAWDVIN